MVNRFFSTLTKPIVLLYLIFFLQFGLFTYTTIHPYLIEPPNQTYVLVRGHYLYSSYIRQSKEGAWSLINTHTTRPTPRAYVHLFFVFLGKIAAIFNIDPPIMYTISRVGAAIALFIATYWFIRVVLPKALHSLAIFFILAVEPGPLLTALSWNPMAWKASIFSYYSQVVAYRHFGLPHHTMGEAVGLLLLGTCILAVRKPSVKRFVLLGILGLLDTIILPPYPIILILTVLIPWGLYELFTKSWKRLVVPFAVAGLAIGAVSLFTKHELSKGYPWKDFNLDEKHWVANGEVLINYVSTLLLYIPFVAFLWMSAVKLWKSWNRDLRITVLTMTSWVILPPFLVLLSSYSWFPLANFRLMDGYNYAPMGVLATLGFSIMLSRIKKQSLAKFLTGFLLTAIVISSVSLTYIYTSQTLQEQYGFWVNVYLGNGHYKAFAFLNTVPKWSGVMVMNHFGEIIPDYAPVRTFIGSTPGFVNWPELYQIASTFYSGKLTDTQAAETLKREDISYVYYSDEEKEYNTTGTLYPNLLTPAFEVPGVTIYKVNARVK